MSLSNFEAFIVYGVDGTPIIKICEGCKTYRVCMSSLEDAGDSSDFVYICNESSPYIEGKGYCPCSSCVIKMICEERCEKYDAFNSKEVSDEDYKSM